MVRGPAGNVKNIEAGLGYIGGVFECRLILDGGAVLLETLGKPDARFCFGVGVGGLGIASSNREIAHYSNW